MASEALASSDRTVFSFLATTTAGSAIRTTFPGPVNLGGVLHERQLEQQRVEVNPLPMYRAASDNGRILSASSSK